MKRRDLLAQLEKAGCHLLRHGFCHEIYHNPETGRSQPVPRHREISEILAKKILRGSDETAGMNLLISINLPRRPDRKAPAAK